MTSHGSRSVVIGVAGGSGSGKTTVVRRIVEAIGPDDVVVVHHDSYYRDASHLPPAERAAINYDHPESLETELLIEHLEQLLAGHGVDVPDADVRLGRRLRRDMEERGRSPESVPSQYMATVRPMHLEFVEPSKRYADLIIPRGGHNKVGVGHVIATVQSAVAGRGTPAVSSAGVGP